MKIMCQLGVILGVCLLGEAVSLLLPVPFPASVISLVLLLAFLLTGLVKLHQIEELANFLLKNMPFFFIPAGLGIMENFETIQGNLLALVLVCVLTTFFTFAATALTVSAVIGLQRKKARQ